MYPRYRKWSGATQLSSRPAGSCRLTIDWKQGHVQSSAQQASPALFSSDMYDPESLLACLYREVFLCYFIMNLVMLTDYT